MALPCLPGSGCRGNGKQAGAARNLSKDTLIVASGGGRIGGRLDVDLLQNGYSRVRAVDIKADRGWFQIHQPTDTRRLDPGDE